MPVDFDLNLFPYILGYLTTYLLMISFIYIILGEIYIHTVFTKSGIMRLFVSNEAKYSTEPLIHKSNSYWDLFFSLGELHISYVNAVRENSAIAFRCECRFQSWSRSYTKNNSVKGFQSKCFWERFWALTNVCKENYNVREFSPKEFNDSDAFVVEITFK